MLKKLGLIASIATLVYSTSSMARLAGAEGTFRNVDSAIHNAVHKAERMFEENHGRAMPSHYPLAKDNPYLHILRVSKNYTIELQFKGGLGSKGQGKDGRSKKNVVVPVAKGLLGAEIVLIPVYNSGDEKITSWECVTNADLNIQEFLGSTGTKRLTASLIREYTTNSYLSLCVYIDQKNLIK